MFQFYPKQDGKKKIKQQRETDQKGRGEKKYTRLGKRSNQKIIYKEVFKESYEALIFKADEQLQESQI